MTPFYLSTLTSESNEDILTLISNLVKFIWEGKDKTSRGNYLAGKQTDNAHKIDKVIYLF